jgi:hypothetical protein
MSGLKFPCGSVRAIIRVRSCEAAGQLRANAQATSRPFRVTAQHAQEIRQFAQMIEGVLRVRGVLAA